MAPTFLPEPPVPSDIDITGMSSFMLNVDRILSSELWTVASADEFRAAFALWCRAWKQTPPASLPSDERVLAGFAGVPFAKWKRIRPMAMRGFILCSDARYYHHVLVEEANRAWAKRQAFRARGAKGNAVRWHSSDDPQAIQQGSHKDRSRSPYAILNDRQGQGQGQGQGISSQEGTSTSQDRAGGEGQTANGHAQAWDDAAPFGGEER